MSPDCYHRSWVKAFSDHLSLAILDNKCILFYIDDNNWKFSIKTRVYQKVQGIFEVSSFSDSEKHHPVAGLCWINLWIILSTYSEYRLEVGPLKQEIVVSLISLLQDIPDLQVKIKDHLWNINWPCIFFLEIFTIPWKVNRHHSSGESVSWILYYFLLEMIVSIITDTVFMTLLCPSALIDQKRLIK
jgi:hypothetical protein